MNHCIHGKTPGNCRCFEPRVIENLEDAEKVFNSGKATWDEWATCASIFAEKKLFGKASDCIVNAIESIRGPAFSDPKLAFLVGRYIGFKADEIPENSNSNAWLRRLSSRLIELQRREFERRNLRFSMLLDEHIAEMLVLAADNSKYGKVALASRLRNPKLSLPKKKSKYGTPEKLKQKMRWGKPRVALRILNDILNSEPENVYALNTRAMIHLDLGNLTDALNDAELSFKINREHHGTINTLATVFIAIGDGERAFELLKPLLEKSWDVITFAFIFCATAVMQELNAEKVREWLEEQRWKLGPEDAATSQRATESAAIKLLLNMGHLLEAIQLLAELHREEWGGPTGFWERQIMLAAQTSVPRVSLPRLEDLIANPKDYYPDHKN